MPNIEQLPEGLAPPNTPCHPTALTTLASTQGAPAAPAPPHHHIQTTTNTNPLRNRATPTIPDHKTNPSGKPPNSYPFVAFVMAVDRKLRVMSKPQQNKINTVTVDHLPLKSPHTRVCGERWVYTKTNSTPHTKKSQTNITQNINTLTKLSLSNQAKFNSTIAKLKRPSIETLVSNNKETNSTKTKQENTKPQTFASSKISINKQTNSKYKTCIDKIIPQTYEEKNTQTQNSHKLRKNQPFINAKLWTQNENIDNQSHTQKTYTQNKLQRKKLRNPNPLYIKTLTHVTTYRFNMAGRGAARDLTGDLDFVTREANSPPQGTKRSGNNKTTSAEKKNKSSSKETSPPTRQFWLGFEMMEKLAIEEGAPINPTPTSVHNLIRSGFSDKEAKEFLKSVPSYPHVIQMCFPLCRPDGIP